MMEKIIYKLHETNNIFKILTVGNYKYTVSPEDNIQITDNFLIVYKNPSAVFNRENETDIINLDYIITIHSYNNNGEDNEGFKIIDPF